MVTLSSGSDASLGNSPSRAGDANHEEDSLSTPRRKGVQQTKNKKTKVVETKSDPDQIVGKAFLYGCHFSYQLETQKSDL